MGISISMSTKHEKNYETMQSIPGAFTDPMSLL